MYPIALLQSVSNVSLVSDGMVGNRLEIGKPDCSLLRVFLPFAVAHEIITNMLLLLDWRFRASCVILLMC